MKKLLTLALCFAATLNVIAADSANDLILSQRNSGNTGTVQRNVTATANNVVAFNSSLVPISLSDVITIGTTAIGLGNTTLAIAGLSTLNGNTFTTGTGTLTLGSVTLNAGPGGTLGTAAFTAASAYEVPLSFTTGLTRTVNTVTVNTSQNIATLSNLTSNGPVYTSDGVGTLNVGTTSGTGTVYALVTSPAFVTPSLGVATATSINGDAITTGTGTLTLGANTLTASNNVTLASDGTGTRTLNIGAGGTLGSNAFNSTGYLPLAGGTLTGALLFTDNTYDIGASGATRPRTGYFGTSVITPSLTDSGLTATRVPFASTAGLLADASTLTFNSGTGALSATSFVGAGTSLTGIPYTITGTTGQITASAGTGNITISLPTALTSIDSVAAESATVLDLKGGATSGNVTIHTNATTLAATFAGANTSLAGTLTVAGNATFSSSLSDVIKMANTVNGNGANLNMTGPDSGATSRTGYLIWQPKTGTNQSEFYMYGTNGTIATFTSNLNATLAGNLTVSGTGTSSFAGLVKTPGFNRVTADVTNATATMSAVSDLSFTVVAGVKYVGTISVFANDSTNTDGLAFDLNGGSATFTDLEFGFAAQPAGSTLGTVTSTAPGTAVTITVVSTSDAVYTISFAFTCNAGGTVIPRFSQNAHSSGTATVRKNSGSIAVASNN